jgi:hypothetical protein
MEFYTPIDSTKYFKEFELLDDGSQSYIEEGFSKE